MNTYGYVKTGMCLIAVGIIIPAVPLLGETYPYLPAVLLGVVPGLAAGLVIAAWIITGKTSDRRFVGACMILVASVFLWVGFTNEAPRHHPELEGYMSSGAYLALTLGPVGAVLCALLLAIGGMVITCERLIGAAMMVPGAGFSLSIILVAAGMIEQATGTWVVEPLMLYMMAAYAVPVTGAALLPLGVALAARPGLLGSKRHKPGYT